MTNPNYETTEARDQELIRACQRGSEAALRDLWDCYHRRIYNLGYRMLGRREDAEELVPEVFLKVWRSCGRFQGRSRVSTWIYQIASNLAIDRLRLGRYSSLLLLEDLSDDGGPTPTAGDEGHPEKAYLRAEEAKHLHHALGHLKPEDRLLVTLYHLQGLPYEEIQAMTGLSNANLKTKLFRARQRLRKHLATLQEDPGPAGGRPRDAREIRPQHAMR